MSTNGIDKQRSCQNGVGRNEAKENGAQQNGENETRYPDGSVKLRNPHIELMDQDILYHLALGSESHDLVEMFGDIKVSNAAFKFQINVSSK
ncbi:hypothetical protein JTB14_019029 [Gonioctena quinquepunctata]|nr:hypothetical protein JTB14_019029 [Gonioctena quinquepunctata]